jgi:hypothetical protein
VFKIHAAPRGLLAMFGMKQEGRNPPDMPETIQCTADVLDNYLEQFFGGTEASAAPAIADVIESVTVTHASGFMWRVWGVYSRVIVNAADVAIDSLHTLELITSGGGVVPLTPEPHVVSFSTQSRRVAFWFPRPIIVRPGVNFRSTCELASAPAGAWSITTGTYAQAIPE